MPDSQTKQESIQRKRQRKELLRRAQILEAMEEHGYHSDHAFHHGTERFAFLLKQPLSNQVYELGEG